MSTLRSRVIRLAAAQPTLRPVLLPLLSVRQANQKSVLEFKRDLEAVDWLRKYEFQLSKANTPADQVDAQQGVDHYVKLLDKRAVPAKVLALKKLGRKALSEMAQEVDSGFMHINTEAEAERVVSILREMDPWVVLPDTIRVGTAGWDLDTYAVKDHGGLDTLAERIVAGKHDGSWFDGHKRPHRTTDAPEQDSRIRKWE